MDEKFQAILDTLPPKAPRSRLEPYAELIHELRRRGRSYREITAILADRCGIRVGVHTLYNFVRVRTAASKKTKPAKAAMTGGTPPSLPAAAPIPTGGHGQDGDVWHRIHALKDRPDARARSAEKVFHYDENEPLTVKSEKDDV
jgi:hypothetical protein